MSAKVLKRALRRPKVIERPVVAAGDRARQLVAAADERARTILESAEAEADEHRRQAAEEGRAEGLAEWQSELAGLAAARDRLLQGAESQILELALGLAEKVLRRRLEADPEAMTGMVREALDALGRDPGRGLVVRVHPDQAPALERWRERLLAADPERASRWRHLEVVADEQLDPAGCRVESEIGSVELGVDTQLRALALALAQGDGR